MKYNYVYLNTNYASNGVIDRNEYNSICVRDLESMDEVQIVPGPLDYSCVFIRRLFNLTRLIDKKLNCRLSRFWYPFLIRIKHNDDKPLCFVVSSYNLPVDYFKYLKKKYPNCRVVKIYRDLIRVITATSPGYSPEKLHGTFDLIMSFDKIEAKKNKLLYFDEIESKINLEIDETVPQSDVFMAAKAKDRLPKIIEAYKALTSAGYKCIFYLTGVSIEERIPMDGIIYADKNMSYIEMLKYSVNSKCLLDINQEGAVGFTSRFIEAVMYNKLLITNNVAVKNTKYYDSGYIMCIDEMFNIDSEFIRTNAHHVDYHYQNDYSPIRLINQIEAELDGGVSG